MDSPRSFTSVWLVMVCFLGRTRLSSAGKCTCESIPKIHFTVQEYDCNKIGDSFRYQCIEGYVRKAGTSNLIRCKPEQGGHQWTKSELQCIPDPAQRPPPKIPDGTKSSTVESSWPGTSPSHENGATSSDITEQSLLGTKHMTTVQSHTVLSSTHSPGIHNNTNITITRGYRGTKHMTTVQSHTALSSTHSPRIHNNTNIPIAGGYTAELQNVGIGLSVVILFFAIIGVSLLLHHRRRKWQIPTSVTEEMQPMNKAG